MPDSAGQLALLEAHAFSSSAEPDSMDEAELNEMLQEALVGHVVLRDACHKAFEEVDQVRLELKAERSLRISSAEQHEAEKALLDGKVSFLELEATKLRQKVDEVHRDCARDQSRVDTYTSHISQQREISMLPVSSSEFLAQSLFVEKQRGAESSAKAKQLEDIIAKERKQWATEMVSEVTCLRKLRSELQSQAQERECLTSQVEGVATLQQNGSFSSAGSLEQELRNTQERLAEEVRSSQQTLANARTEEAKYKCNEAEAAARLRLLEAKEADAKAALAHAAELEDGLYHMLREKDSLLKVQVSLEWRIQDLESELKRERLLRGGFMNMLSPN